MCGKWHLGSTQGRLPNDQGFDEWYGMPRTTDEAFWATEPQAKAAGAEPERIMAPFETLKPGARYRTSRVGAFPPRLPPARHDR
jgi:hypothetical protein